MYAAAVNIIYTSIYSPFASKSRNKILKLITMLAFSTNPRINCVITRVLKQLDVDGISKNQFNSTVVY